MLIDLPAEAWYRAPAPGAELAARSAVRDAATARALQAYLSTRSVVPVRTTVETTL